ncbi:MAG: carbohydrate kinase family protein [Candidatus Bathyarchaeia archaeon]
MSPEAICFGALNLDRLYRVERIAGGGEESFILDCEETPGGSAANTAVGMARLELKTGYIGKVASDREGEILLKSFRDEGVDTGGVIVSKSGRSGTVTGYIDKKGERALYVDPGVNDTLRFEEISLDYAGSAKLLHLTSFVGTIPFEAQKKLVKILPNIEVSFDPGEIYARKGLRALKPLVKRSRVIFPNENELKLLTGAGYVEGSRILLNEGADIVAVKLAERGCYVTDGKEAYLVEPNEVKVVDTTGAGDAFCAGFLYGLLNNKDLHTCGRIGNFVASRCIMRVGARAGLPKLADLRRLRFA